MADTFWYRFCGLQGHSALPEGTGLYIRPCRMVHTFFMRFPIDLIFLDPAGRIVHIEKDLRPWKLSRHIPAAEGVLECLSGTVESLDLKLGQAVRLKPQQE